MASQRDYQNKNGEGWQVSEWVSGFTHSLTHSLTALSCRFVELSITSLDVNAWQASSTPWLTWDKPWITSHSAGMGLGQGRARY
jgi:hypothetical protein